MKILKFMLFSTILLAQTGFAQNEIPLRDFFRNPDKTGYGISTDGKYISYLAPFNNRLNIFVRETDKETARKVTDSKERDITIYFWKGKNRILYLQDNGGDENYKLFAVNADGSNPKVLTPFEKVRTEIVDELKGNDEEVLISLNKRSPEVFDVYRLNINSGEMKIAAENPGNITAWMTDHEGKIRIAITTDGVNTGILYRNTEEEAFRELVNTNFKETLTPLFFTFDNKNIYAASNIGRDKSSIIRYDTENSRELDVIFEHPDVDVSDLSYSRKRKVLTDVSYVTWKKELYFFDEESKEVYNRISVKTGKEYEIIITDYDESETKMIIRTYSDRSLGSFYFYDKEKDSLIKLCDVSPWLKENELAKMKPVKYKSRDGLTINGYLTLPNTAEHKNIPFIINPHGGPWYRDKWGFNPEVQFLVNRGFGVLQMNFRGSTGYGRSFWEASFKQWGKQMQDDITDGVKWLIDEGIADRNKIAIYGGSYGGYAVLAGLAFTPEIYTAGVDYVGVSNLFTFLKSIPPYWKPYLEMLYEMVGNPGKDSSLLEEASPVLHANKITAPIFIAQGKNDPRVNINESDQMVTAMKKRGIEVEYMVKDNEGHGFYNEENRFDFYGAMEKFLKKHLLSK